MPTPECRLETRGPLPFPLVWKPRDGAGSLATFLVRSAADLDRCPDIARSEGWAGEAVLQPFIAGQPVSVAFLTGPCGLVPLLPAMQDLSADGRFRYRGGTLPLPPALAERAVALGRRALETLSGLSGYVGVDLVLGAEDHIMEINPRLTTSYIGLRALCRTNLAETWLNAVRGLEVTEPQWRPGSVCFCADGSITAEASGAA